MPLIYSCLRRTCWLIDRWFKSQGWQSASRIALIFAVCWFYVSQSEWCHCQRDNWLLLPVFGALTLRRMLMIDLAGHRNLFARVFLFAWAEGLVWGMAIWLKPHVLIPAANVWVVAWLSARPGKQALLDVLGLFTGGLLVGALGSLWMIQHECWLPFWETVREWNPRILGCGARAFYAAQSSGIGLAVVTLDFPARSRHGDCNSVHRLGH